MSWNPFKRKPKPEPVRWDGHHLYAMTENPRFGVGADDFKSGWLWNCTCGEDNTRLNWRLPHTEAEALEQFKAHRRSRGLTS